MKHAIGQPVLRGVDHTARPTWKLRETIEFYRDVLGLPLVHAITAKGWGREKEQHADFIHFFFDSGNDNTSGCRRLPLRPVQRRGQHPAAGHRPD